MRTYKQTVKFEKVFEIQAPDAATANEILDDRVRTAEWEIDAESQGFYDFEDDPVECPECKGECEMNSQACPVCHGDGVIPFVA